MKKPEAVRLEQAPSAVSRLFRDCFAILGLLRRPPPDLRTLFTKLACNPCSRNEVGLPTSMVLLHHSRISKSDRIELARFRSSFVLRRISGARYKSSPIQLSGGSNKDRQSEQHRPPKVFAQLYYETNPYAKDKKLLNGYTSPFPPCETPAGGILCYESGQGCNRGSWRFPA